MTSLLRTALVLASTLTLPSAALAADGPRAVAEQTDPAPALPAHDEAGPAPKAASSRFHLDLETDPTAFAFRGFSLHLGLGYRHVRLDLGTYGMDVPSFAEKNDGFTSSFSGAGAKLQVFPFAEQRGAFFGIDGGVNRLRAEDHATGDVGKQTQVSAGVNGGYRFSLPFGLYVTPWLGVSRAFGADRMTVGGRTYEPQKVLVFPAVHVGMRFQ